MKLTNSKKYHAEDMWRKFQKNPTDILSIIATPPYGEVVRGRPKKNSIRCMGKELFFNLLIYNKLDSTILGKIKVKAGDIVKDIYHCWASKGVDGKYQYFYCSQCYK
jgi:hypothetical protein